MASHMDEPSTKKQRLDPEELLEGQPRSRDIKLDMTKYKEWVRVLADEELVSIFELGVKVRESVTFTVDVGPKFMNENALAPKIEEITGTMNNVETKVHDKVLNVQQVLTTKVCEGIDKMTTNVLIFKTDLSDDIKKIGERLQTDVKEIATRVPALNTLGTAIKESESRINQSLEKQGEKLDLLSTALRNPQKKGARAEKDVLGILHQNLRRSNFTFRDTSREKGKGDIEADTPDGHKIMIEIKNWESALTKDAIESFEGNLAKVPHFRVGILLSMKSGIANRSKRGQFGVMFNDDQKQYMIYVPNAHGEEDLIVWSVLMASQLANIQVGELGEKKTQGLRKVYEEFQKNVQRSKDSRINLEALKAAVQQLEENVVPILDSVDKASKDLNKLLNK
ncbi:hypothetical protein AWC38_SpisGene3431 [Stylophora pistillata]|uniref:Uncharacterized protein n=1 Tax=Stylophora pistillata TaxID=50429 RepID=A0A2B4SQP2_STYPI|nr:hypothetical protein AWC38_SpisGene3431 [Stylophora pistillata]